MTSAQVTGSSFRRSISELILLTLSTLCHWSGFRPSAFPHNPNILDNPTRRNDESMTPLHLDPKLPLAQLSLPKQGLHLVLSSFDLSLRISNFPTVDVEPDRKLAHFILPPVRFVGLDGICRAFPRVASWLRGASGRIGFRRTGFLIEW